MNQILEVLKLLEKQMEVYRKSHLLKKLKKKITENQKYFDSLKSELSCQNPILSSFYEHVTSSSGLRLLN